MGMKQRPRRRVVTLSLFKKHKHTWKSNTADTRTSRNKRLHNRLDVGRVGRRDAKRAMDEGDEDRRASDGGEELEATRAEEEDDAQFQDRK